MLSALEKAKRNGATIVAVNPLPEAGLMRFENPQTPRGVVLGGTKLADEFVQIRLGGDQALFQAIGKHLLEAEERDGGVLDHEFIDEHTTGFGSYAAAMSAVPWRELVAATGVPEKALRRVAERVRTSKATIVCWAMGLTQHKHSVATLRDVVNVLLLQGNIGRPGAGVCPVRGHSNVQGDRTMGIYEKPAEHFLQWLDDEFAFHAPREHGYDTVEAIRAMRDGKARVFMAMGGNFVSATPDTNVVEAALRQRRSDRAGLDEAEPLARRHGTPGDHPADPRPHRSRRARRRRAARHGRGLDERRARLARTPRAAVRGHAERGRDRRAAVRDGLRRAARTCRSPTGRRSSATTPASASTSRAWSRASTTSRRRSRRARTLYLPNAPARRAPLRDRLRQGRVHREPARVPVHPAGRLLLQTLRSHDQYNTTIYGKDDRYRGIHGGRRVIMVNAKDIQKLGFAEGDIVDLVSEWRDGVERRAEEFRIVAYSTPRGNAAAYYPETNVLVPLDSVADVSGTPTSKSVIVRLERRAA